MFFIISFEKKMEFLQEIAKRNNIILTLIFENNFLNRF